MGRRRNVWIGLMVLAVLLLVPVLVNAAFGPPQHQPPHREDSRIEFVTIQRDHFSPDMVVIHPGGRVTWTNQTRMRQQLVFHGFTSPSIARGERWTRTFTSQGVFRYHLASNPRVQGKVTVRFLK